MAQHTTVEDQVIDMCTEPMPATSKRSCVNAPI